jgi:hypothetical protein
MSPAVVNRVRYFRQEALAGRCLVRSTILRVALG